MDNGPWWFQCIAAPIVWIVEIKDKLFGKRIICPHCNKKTTVLWNTCKHCDGDISLVLLEKGIKVKGDEHADHVNQNWN